MVEWYRTGFSLQQIMAETAALVARLLEVPRCSQRQAPSSSATATPSAANWTATRWSRRRRDWLQLCIQHGLAAQSVATATRDDLLDFLVATQIGPRLGMGGITCLHHYPASQAALAQLDAADPRTALRFELYAQGLELANGFVELADAGGTARAIRGRPAATRSRADLPDIEPDPAAAGRAGIRPARLRRRRAGIRSRGDAGRPAPTRIDEVMAVPVGTRLTPAPAPTWRARCTRPCACRSSGFRLR